jgi:DNA-binding transcriptional LysR family regulator
MELRQLRYFLAVAHELHFGRAAQALHMTQPPLSAQIRQLERELGLTLFMRTTRRVELTPAGRELRDRLTEVLADLDSALAGLPDAAAGHRGRLSVGFTSSAGSRLVPGAVRRFREVAPRVELSLLPLTTAEQLDRLHDGALDLAVVRDLEASAGLDVEPLLSEELVAHLPADSPVLDRSRETISPRELGRLGMISFPYRLMPGYVGKVLEIFRGLELPPRVVHRTVHQETALGFVAAGLGFVILPQSSCRLATEGTVPRRLTRPTESVTSLARRAGQLPLGTDQLFARCLRESAAAAR